MFTQNFQFSTCFPHVHPCSFQMQDDYEFSNEKLRSGNGEKNFFFVKDDNVFTQIYIYDNNNKNIYMLIYKKSLKKCLRLFHKTFSNCQATYQKELYLLFEKSGNFSQSEHRDRFDCTLSLFVFICSLRTPSPLHNKPFIKKGLLEEMEGVNDNGCQCIHVSKYKNK